MLELDVVLARPGFELRVTGACTAIVTGVFGASGSGKTTLLHLIAGLVSPSAGRVVLDGDVLVDTGSGIDVPAHARRVGVVFQDDRLFPHLTVRGNLEFGYKLLPAGGRRFSFASIVELLELAPLLDRRPAALSGGEKQRVTLGRALLRSPRLLLCDEPLASLDQRLKEQILPFLQRVRDVLAMPTLYVSHDIREILRLTRDLLVLESGRIVGAGAYREISFLPSPPLGRADLVNVFEADVWEEADVTFARIAPPAGGEPLTLHAAGRVPAAGARPSITILPDDVALARSRIEGISIQNQIPGRVTRIATGGAQTLVEIDVGVPLLARITPRAEAELGIRAGGEIWCLIKAGAVSVSG